jgi:hypothetical protein
MGKGSSSGSKNSGRKGHGPGGGGRPAPIPPNNGQNPAGWPSTTDNPSGRDRNNASPKNTRG